MKGNATFLPLEGRVGLYLAFRYDILRWSGRELARPGKAYGLLILEILRRNREAANVP
jgi:hypothetical protein